MRFLTVRVQTRLRNAPKEKDLVISKLLNKETKHNNNNTPEKNKIQRFSIMSSNI